MGSGYESSAAREQKNKNAVPGIALVPKKETNRAFSAGITVRVSGVVGDPQSVGLIEDYRILD